jgi:drug/metabolite transporter (DMT)-like permease
MAYTLVFALLAGVCTATYTIFIRLGSTGINPALGAAIVTGVAFLVNVAVMLSMRAAGTPIAFSSKSAWLLVVVGIAAAGVDLFMLLAYSSGLRITSSFIIGGTSTVLILLVGFLVLQEPFSWTKLAAVAMILGGILLLQYEGL